MMVSMDSVSPTVATESAPRRETKKTSTTANTDSSTSSRTIGIASRRIARPIGPSVYTPWCEPAIDCRMVVQRRGSAGTAASELLMVGGFGAHRNTEDTRTRRVDLSERTFLCVLGVLCVESAQRSHGL